MKQQSFKESCEKINQQIEINQNQIRNLSQTYQNTKIYKIRGPPKGTKRKPNTSVGIKSGMWNINEIKAYLKFITRFEKHFQDKFTRKKKKIFYRMSNFIKSRTAEQCRSHHQKLELKLTSHKNILEFISSQIAKIMQKIKNHKEQSKQNLKKWEKNHNSKEEQIYIKLQNISAEPEQDQKNRKEEKKTQLNQLKEDEYFQIQISKNVLFITIQEQYMEIWH